MQRVDFRRRREQVGQVPEAVVDERLPDLRRSNRDLIEHVQHFLGTSELSLAESGVNHAAWVRLELLDDRSLEDLQDLKDLLGGLQCGVVVDLKGLFDVVLRQLDWLLDVGVLSEERFVNGVLKE